MATLFLNLTNHPSARWEPAQRQAALALADEIVDHPFPPVDPAAGLERLEREAGALVDDIVRRWGDRARHALVQGEFVMTTLLVQGLQRLGVTCHAATTERLVAAADGQVRRFRFVRLRLYPRLTGGAAP